MITKSVQIGKETYTVSGDTLQEVLQQAADLQTIARRVNKDSWIEHRKTEGFDFYEAFKRVKGRDGGYRRAIKQFGNSDGTLFLSANEPWRLYDKETDTEYVQFDFLTDEVKEWGFDESAVNGWVPAKAAKKGKLRVYKPVAAPKKAA